MDKQLETGHSTSSNIFLTGTILLANLDFSGLLDYGFRTLIGGVIWIGCKLTMDYIERKRKAK